MALQDGDIVNIDVTVYLNVSKLIFPIRRFLCSYFAIQSFSWTPTISLPINFEIQGYHGDTSATFFVGAVNEEARSLVKVRLPGRFTFIFILFISNNMFDF